MGISRQPDNRGWGSTSNGEARYFRRLRRGRRIVDNRLCISPRLAKMIRQELRFQLDSGSHNAQGEGPDRAAMAKSPSDHREIIGWREYVSFPEWGVNKIEAKIDTGARTSAIHVKDVVRLKGNRVRFHLVTRRGRRDKPERSVEVKADLVRTTRVRSSIGQVQERYVVSTLVRIGGVRRRIELSLVCRNRMICRMLLGRLALNGFLIDAASRYVCSRSAKPAVISKGKR